MLTLTKYNHFKRQGFVVCFVSMMKLFRETIIRKFCNGDSPGAIFKALKPLGIKRNLVYTTIKRYKETSSIEDRKRSGRPRSARTDTVVKIVRERLRRKKHRSIRKLAADLKISRGSVHNILRVDLGCYAYKKRKVHGISEVTKKKRVQRSNTILSWHAGDEFVFSDEKLFVLEQPHNAQNDRLWAPRIEDIPGNQKNVPRFQSSPSVMVWGAVCKRGKLPLVFIDKGVKINALYYKTEVLEKIVAPNLKGMFGNEYYVFQQDGAPSHTANAVQAWCQANLTDFLPKHEWPPSSPDLNVLDYFVWSYMLSKLNNYKIINLDHFKKVIEHIWDEMPMEMVRAACDSFEKRLRLIKKVKGGVIPKHLL